mmetsp:Transcript_7765/g.11177  ORF Transcript_7765/g.11177 Transcript_7765/m.11177 type:complete len:87 (+) Transcript_7765:251-511(+)
MARKPKKSTTRQQQRKPKTTRNQLSNSSSASNNSNANNTLPKNDNVMDCSISQQHEDCQCYLRKGLFLPKGLLEDYDDDDDNHKRL